MAGTKKMAWGLPMLTQEAGGRPNFSSSTALGVRDLMGERNVAPAQPGRPMSTE